LEATDHCADNAKPDAFALCVDDLACAEARDKAKFQPLDDRHRRSRRHQAQHLPRSTPQRKTASHAAASDGACREPRSMTGAVTRTKRAKRYVKSTQILNMVLFNPV
jgi:hypothetical protein